MFSKFNCWYVNDDIHQVINLLKSRYIKTKVFTYGSSMGAYAAINLACKVNAQFIAISPQCTVLPTILEKFNDNRWNKERKNFNLSNDNLLNGSSADVSGIIIYDNTHIDSLHVNELCLYTQAKLVKVPGSRHPSGDIFNFAYGLKKLLLKIFNQDVCVESIQAQIDEKLNSTALFLSSKLNQHIHKLEFCNKIMLPGFKFNKKIFLNVSDHVGCEDYLLISVFIKTVESDLESLDTNTLKIFIDKLRKLGFHQHIVFILLSLSARKVANLINNDYSIVEVVVESFMLFGADKLRDISLLSNDINVAYKVMLLAKELRPKGYLINIKLLEFKKLIKNVDVNYSHINDDLD